MLIDFQNALLILKKESNDNNRFSVINMINNSHNQSFQSMNPDDNDSSQGNRQATRPATTGHHLRIIRTLSQLSQQSEEHHSLHSTPKNSHAHRGLNGFKAASTSHIFGKKNKFQK